MVLGQLLTAFVVPVSRPAIIFSTSLGRATTLDLIDEAVNIRAGDRTDVTDAAAAGEHGVQSNNVGDNFWDDFAERIE